MLLITCNPILYQVYNYKHMGLNIKPFNVGKSCGYRGIHKLNDMANMVSNIPTWKDLQLTPTMIEFDYTSQQLLHQLTQDNSCEF